MSVDQLDAVQLRGLNNPASPFISPDSKWIGFVSGGEFEKVSMDRRTADFALPYSRDFAGRELEHERRDCVCDGRPGQSPSAWTPPGLSWLSPLIKLGAICGLSSVVLVGMLAQSRIFYTMANDGLLPRLVARIHPRFRTPHITTIVTGLVTAVIAGTTPIAVLGELVSTGTLFATGPGASVPHAVVAGGAASRCGDVRVSHVRPARRHVAAPAALGGGGTRCLCRLRPASQQGPARASRDDGWLKFRAPLRPDGARGGPFVIACSPPETIGPAA